MCLEADIAALLPRSLIWSKFWRSSKCAAHIQRVLIRDILSPYEIVAMDDLKGDTRIYYDVNVHIDYKPLEYARRLVIKAEATLFCMQMYSTFYSLLVNNHFNCYVGSVFYY